MVDKAVTVERVREMFGPTPVPCAFALYEAHPAFHADFYMNFKRFVWADGYLTPKNKAAIALAISFATGCRPWSDYFSLTRFAALGFPEAAAGDIRALVAVNSMYNQFYKLPDLMGRGLAGMAVGLRGHTIAATCLDGEVIELIGVVMGTLNGCRTCATGHARAALNSAVPDEAILEANQCAATMLAGCVFLNSL